MVYCLTTLSATSIKTLISTTSQFKRLSFIGKDALQNGDHLVQATLSGNICLCLPTGDVLCTTPIHGIIRVAHPNILCIEALSWDSWVHNTWFSDWVASVNMLCCGLSSEGVVDMVSSHITLSHKPMSGHGKKVCAVTQYILTLYLWRLNL